MRYKYDINIFHLENETSFYLLGLYITDGNIFLKRGNEVSLKIIDLSLLTDIKNLVCSEKPIGKVKDSNCYKLTFSNYQIADWFVKYGCIENKTKVVKFPIIPEQYYPDLIRGLLDGDGSVGYYNNKAIVRFDSASLSLITGVSNKFIEWDIDNKIHLTPWISTSINGQVVKSTTQMYRITLTGLKVYRLLKIIYPINCLCLDRKHKIAVNIINNYEKNLSYKELIRKKNLINKEWPEDLELSNLFIKHRGILVNAAKELKVNSWALSCRLRKIGSYDLLRKQFPIQNINNIKNKKRPLKLSESIINEIYQNIDNNISYSEIASTHDVNISYIAFLQRRRKNKNI